MILSTPMVGNDCPLYSVIQDRGTLGNGRESIELAQLENWNKMYYVEYAKKDK